MWYQKNTSSPPLKNGDQNTCRCHINSNNMRCCFNEMMSILHGYKTLSASKHSIKWFSVLCSPGKVLIIHSWFSTDCWPAANYVYIWSNISLSLYLKASNCFSTFLMIFFFYIDSSISVYGSVCLHFWLETFFSKLIWFANGADPHQSRHLQIKSDLGLYC